LIGCFDDKDYPQTEENQNQLEKEREEAEEKGVGCQPEDDYCDYDQNCEWTSIDCIDDMNLRDDGEDSDEEEEDHVSNCGGEECTDTEKENKK
jgi:hypothetical protein